MGRYNNTGLAYGTLGNNDLTLEQMEYDFIETQSEVRLVKNYETDTLIKELEKNGSKFNREKIHFITKDKSGMIIWLEQGNDSAGLEHIYKHADDFKRKLGIDKEEIASTLYDIVKNGKIVSTKVKKINGRNNFEKIYQYKDQFFILTGIGSNGFIVTAYPINKKGE